MASKVFMIDLRATHKENFLSKLGRLMKEAGMADTFKERDLVALKLHFGEWGNTAYIRPVFVRKVADAVKESGAIPFLTDANTLYAGSRGHSPQHLETAERNGFTYSVVGAPLVIADGLRGKSHRAVEIGLKRFQKAYIGAEIHQADSLVSVAHFKGHELSGFGGAIKNIGMGCASRRGKLAQHSTLSPSVKRKKCVGCADCAERCASDAILMVEGKARIDGERCVGCGECILICPNSAIDIQWNQSIPVFLENMVEYAFGVLKGKEGRAFFLNFLTDISPACDCYPTNDAPIVRNIGVLASKDPVAIDQASADLVNSEPALPGCCLSENTEPGQDKFRGLYPHVDWTIQLDYAERIGLGERSYDLVRL
jgi:uncharacterized protein